MPESWRDDEEARRCVQRITNDLAVLKSQMANMDKELTKLVTRMEFAPVKLLVYGLAGTLLSGVIVGLLAILIRHPAV